MRAGFWCVFMSCRCVARHLDTLAPAGTLIGKENAETAIRKMAYIDFSNIHGHRQALNLSGHSFTIGRDPGCDISFPDRRISRSHSRLFFEDDRWYVEDLHSTNGTMVNQESVDVRALAEGDVIQLGPFSLVYRTGRDQEPSIVLDREEMTRVIARGKLLQFTRVADSSQRWEILLEIAEALDAMGTTGELLTHFMEALQQIFTPSTAIIVLGDEYLRNPKKSGTTGESEKLESSIARVMARVREKKQGVVFDGETSIIPDKSREIGSQMCAPIIARGEIRGVIYLNRLREDINFNEEDLRTLLIFCRLIVTATVSSEKLARLDAENRMMSATQGKAGTIVGNSAKTRELISMIEKKVGPVDTTVLFTGETGTGKSWAAQALHLASRRAKGPFIKVNCAAIPDNLIESELFGYEKGAFSGANARKAGLFEAANGGTLFLDEISELNSSSQAKLLMVLQDRQLQRLGSTRLIDVDIRIIAATNADLREAVDTGIFRSDLYYRLNVVTLDIPPLRERQEDILPLASHFLVRFSSEAGKHISGMTDAVQVALEAYPWPGNIRELSNAVERAVIFAENNQPITPSDFPDEIMHYQQTSPLNADKQNEKRLVESALKQARGNRREAARILGWYPQKLYARLKEYNIV
jgi:Nif-specific regulatory protein